MAIIDSEALKGAFELDGYLSPYVRRLIDACPAVDAVPVVRCRDCGYAILDRWHKSRQERPPVWRCRKFGRLTVPDGFCHRGKIREEDLHETD